MRNLYKSSFLILLVIGLCLLSSWSFASWPFQTNNDYNFSSPAIADIDSYGMLDLVFTSWNGNIYAVDAAGNPKWTVNFGQPYYVSNSSSPTLSDVDGNPSTLETIFGTGQGYLWGKLYIISSAGVVLATYDTPNAINSSPLVVDADFDGVKEVYFGEAGYTSNNRIFYALNIRNQGGVVSFETRWTRNLDTGGSSSTPAAGELIQGPKIRNNATGNFDSVYDGLEIVVSESGTPNSAAGGKKIYAFSNKGSLLWSFSTNRFNNYNSPTIVDLDNDGIDEVIQSSTDGYIYCLNGRTGALKWSKQLLGSVMHTQAVGDIVGNDGLKEIVVGSYVNSGGTDYLYLLSHNGQTVWIKPFPTGTEINFSSPTIVDLNRDGSYEIVLGTGTEGSYSPNAYIIAIDKDANILWQIPQPGSVYSSISTADMDGDLYPELCFGAYGISGVSNGYYNCLDKDGNQFQYSNKGPIVNFMPWPSIHKNNKNIRLFN